MEVGINERLDRAGRAGLDLGLAPKVVFDLPAQSPCVAGRIGDDAANALVPADQHHGLQAVVALPGGRDQPRREPRQIGSGMGPGRQTAT
ncbi:hypothetical protein [Rhodovulum sp. YEN HP10]|uniref:hypothetical protein n=1 Tax=Rhodovulum sp. HP10 TaxID=3387397 RepID=UPI0039E1825A